MMQTSDKTSAKPRRAKIGSALLKYGVPLVISVGLCYLLFRGDGINFADMWQTVKRECDFRWIAANIILGLMAQVFRACRWRIQLSALDIRPSLWQIVLSIFGTYSVNLVFPRLGEVWRTGYIAAREKAPFTTVFGSMVADRLADTLTVFLLMLAVFIPAGAQLGDYLSQSGGAMESFAGLLTSPVLWGLVTAVVVAVVVIFVKFPEHKAVVKVRDIFRGLWEGFAVIVKMPGKGKWLILTALIWTCYFMSFYCAMLSFPVTTEVIATHGVIAAAVCFVLSSLSMGVPSNGGIGPWQWAVMFGLMLYSAGVPGMTREYALTFANLVMGVQTLVLIIQGLFTFGCIAVGKRPTKNAAGQ